MSETKFVLKGGSLPDGSMRNILIIDDSISAIDATVNEADATVIDVTGSVILPGLVDLHTHLREPGREDAETVE